MKKTKKILMIVTTVMLLLGVLGPIASAVPGETTGIIAEDVYLDYSQDFTVTFTLAYMGDLYGIQLDMVFDPELVNINSITLHEIFGDDQGSVNEIINNIDNEAGTLEYCSFLQGPEHGANIFNTTDAITLNCTAQGVQDVWEIITTDDGLLELVVGGINTRVLLSDSVGTEIKSTLPQKSITIDTSCSI